MHSELFRIGPIVIQSYGAMMAAGFLLGLVNWVWLGRREGRSPTFCSDLLFWIAVSGILGARAAYVAAEWRAYASDPISILRIDQGGLIYYGGLLASSAALVVFARRRAVNLTALLDFVVTSVPLAHAFGRVGCFFNGCCYGRPGELPWCVRFPRESLVWWNHVQEGLIHRHGAASLPVHPTQLYEAAFNLALYGLVAVHFRRRRRDGTTLALYLLVYPVGRFLLEFVRGHDRVFVGGLSMAQCVSLGLFALGLGVAWRARTSRGTVKN